ncbi:MAG: serine/threonine protein kinase [Acetatifactor sp.]|nr:serine/threonine protein kinase [Acetatifactor sp.]
MKRNSGEDVNGEYHYIRVVGEGAFSRVYLVEDQSGKRHACKVSREVRMLRREAEILSRLHHPLFPAYMGYEERRGTGKIVMEYISGRNLGQMIRLRGGFSARQAMRIAEELADGLRYLHERQPPILYRDLKPENIMVCQDGHIKLIDFGCACCQEAQSGERVGTPGFAPPEQLAVGEDAGSYSDVYGLGRTIQSVMTKRRTGCDGRRDSDQGDEYRDRRQKGTGGKRKSRIDGDRCCAAEKGNHRAGMSCVEEKGNCRAGMCCGKDRRRRREERICRRRLERMIEAAVREDFRQRPQDMISILQILTGKRKKEEGIICEKNIWESSCKNSCSLPLI